MDSTSPSHASVIVGTAGHIDHGKTTLVRALTGVDCDRLDEEKRRGITIVLGFAPLTLPSLGTVGVVDVPGHERFVRTMVAGAGGVDVALLVVAADEGVMPQTREHLHVLRLLRVPQLVVALTRMDLVDPELLELAELDAAELLAGTPYADAAIIPVSAVDGRGLHALRLALAAAVARLPARRAVSVFRFPVDRSFSIRGFGTVVTGTTRGGSVEVGATLEVLPGRERVRVRGIQVHGHSAESVGRGQRVALNLQGVEAASVPVGAWLGTPGAVACSDRLDVVFDLLPDLDRPLLNNARVRFLCGTAEVMATVRLIDPDGGPAPADVLPGSVVLAQLALAEQVGAVAGDRFVLRSESPLGTLGGGEILDPEPPLLRRRDRAQTAALLAVLARPNASISERIVAFLTRHEGEALDLSALRRRLPPADGLAAAADALPGVARLPSDPPSWASTAVVAQWAPTASAFVTAHHRAHPLLDGASIAEVRQALLPVPAPRLFEALLDPLCATALLVRRGPRLADRNHAASPDPGQREALNTLLRRLEAGGVHPPPLEEATSDLTLPPDALAFLLSEGQLLRVADDFLVARAPFVDLVRRLVDHVATVGPLTPQAFKDLSGLTRRHAMPFLEFLDRERVTVRVGNERAMHDDAARWLGP